MTGSYCKRLDLGEVDLPQRRRAPSCHGWIDEGIAASKESNRDFVLDWLVDQLARS